jgi:nucleoside phosphorylase/CheY-like chemotaxis protein
MKVLIVEDDIAKGDDIQRYLTNELRTQPRPPAITRTDHLSEAIRLASARRFDLVVLDLMLPYLKDGRAEAMAGVEILRQIRQPASPNVHSTIVGLSAYPEEVSEFRSTFEEAGVLIIQYDGAGLWETTLSNIISNMRHRQVSQVEYDFVVLTALEEERRGFDKTDVKVTSRSVVSGLDVHEVTFTRGNRTRRGALIKARQMGLASALIDTAAILSNISTKILCMSGICAGFKSRSSLGQLIVASPAWEYQAGKWSKNNFEIAPDQIPLRSSTRVNIEQLIREKDFIDGLENEIGRDVTRPAVFAEPKVAPVASGSAVIADSSRLTHIEPQHRKLAALDMETFGLYYAAHEIPNRIDHFFSVKCIVDLADEVKSDDLHRYGAIVSARATLAMIERLSAGD